MRDLIQELLALIVVFVGLAALTIYSGSKAVPLVEQDPSLYHLHEEMPYRVMHRPWSDTLCITTMQLVRNNKHVPVPANLDEIVRDFMARKIEFQKPKI